MNQHRLCAYLNLLHLLLTHSHSFYIWVHLCTSTLRSPTYQKYVYKTNFILFCLSEENTVYNCCWFCASCKPSYMWLMPNCYWIVRPQAVSSETAEKILHPSYNPLGVIVRLLALYCAGLPQLTVYYSDNTKTRTTSSLLWFGLNCAIVNRCSRIRCTQHSAGRGMSTGQYSCCWGWW